MREPRCRAVGTAVPSHRRPAQVRAVQCDALPHRPTRCTGRTQSPSCTCIILCTAVTGVRRRSPRYVMMVAVPPPSLDVAASACRRRPRWAVGSDAWLPRCRRQCRTARNFRLRRGDSRAQARVAAALVDRRVYGREHWSRQLRQSRRGCAACVRERMKFRSRIVIASPSLFKGGCRNRPAAPVASDPASAASASSCPTHGRAEGLTGLIFAAPLFQVLSQLITSSSRIDDDDPVLRLLGFDITQLTMSAEAISAPRPAPAHTP